MFIIGEELLFLLILVEVYSKVGLFWFDYYDGDCKVIEGVKVFGNIKFVKVIFEVKCVDIWLKEKLKIDYLVKKIKGMKVLDGLW